jgi:dipeptidyl aminopeptidase/acylaminoacyl peptidase
MNFTLPCLPIQSCYRYTICVFALLVLSPTSSGQTPATTSSNRLPRTDLLLYRTAQGKHHKATTPSEWLQRRNEILNSMEAVMGNMPDDSKRCDLEPETLEEVDAGSYIRRLITYQSEPGSRVPAYLNLPKRSLQPGIQARAALCLHPTDNQVGHKVVMGLGGRPGRQYAHELAERGWITLAPAYPLLANYQPNLHELGYESGTMKAIWDNRRGLDLLESLPNVNTSGFAAIGHSLGGHNAIYTAVFDARIQVVVTSCGFDSFLDYKNGDIRGWTSERYMPRLLDYTLEEIPFDFHELVAALAPRGIFICAPKGDDNFKWQSVARIVECAQTVYELRGKSSNLHAEHPDCGHDFPAEIRNQSYEFMESRLPQH